MEQLVRHAAGRWHGALGPRHGALGPLAQLQSLPALARFWVQSWPVHTPGSMHGADQVQQPSFPGACHLHANAHPIPTAAAPTRWRRAGQSHHLSLISTVQPWSGLITAAASPTSLGAWRHISSSHSCAATSTMAATTTATASEIDFRFPFVPNPVESKRPEDLVGRGNKLLTTYKKNLHPRQLVHRIMIRPGVNNILPLLKLYQSRLDGIAVAAVLAKTARTYKHTPPADRPALITSATETLTWLEPYARFQMRYCSVAATMGILYGWARLPPALRQVWPQDVSGYLLKHITRPDKSGDPKDHKLRKESPRTFTVLAWSVSQLYSPQSATQDPLVQHFATTLSHFAAKRITHFNPSGLATFTSSIASLSPATAKQLLQSHVAPEAARRIGLITERQFTLGELLTLLRTCADVQLQHVTLFEKAAASVVPQLSSWAARDVAAVADVFGRLLVRHEGLMQAAGDTVLQRRGEFSPEQVAQVAAACRAVKCPHAGLEAAS